MTVEVWADWSSVAAGWDRFRDAVERTEQDVTTQLLAGLAPLDGRRVLELGGGTGELAALLADAVGPTGSVVASDAASGMVDLQRTRLAGLANVEVAQLDALNIDLPADSVDAVVCRMSLMLTVDPDRALAEVARVLRPGGRFAAAVWGPPGANPWLTVVGIAAMMQGLIAGGPPVGPGEPFSLADGDALRERVAAAGFDGVAVHTVDSVRTYDEDQHFEMVRSLAPPLAAALSAATPQQVAAVRESVRGMTEQFRTADGLVIPGQALVCSATASATASTSASATASQ